MTIFNRFLNLDTNKCFMMSDSLAQGEGSDEGYVGGTKGRTANGRDNMFFFLANQKFHTDMFWFDLKKEEDRKEYVRFISLIKGFAANIQKNYDSESGEEHSLENWIVHSDEFLRKAIIPSLKVAGGKIAIDQEALKMNMRDIFTKEYSEFSEKDLEELIEIASKHISKTMIEKAKLYLIAKKVQITDAERERRKLAITKAIEKIKGKNNFLTAELIFEKYWQEFIKEYSEICGETHDEISKLKPAYFQRLYLEKPRVYTFEIRNINPKLLGRLSRDKILDYLVAIEAEDKTIEEILKKIGVPVKKINGLIKSSKAKMRKGLQYSSEKIALDPSFLPAGDAYDKEMEENVEFQLAACKAIVEKKEGGIDRFPLAKFIYSYMKDFDSSAPNAFDGGEKHLFRFFGNQFKNYTSYVYRSDGTDKSFSIQGFLNFLGSDKNEIPGTTDKKYSPLKPEILSMIGKILYAQFGNINLNDDRNRDFFEANLRLMHNAAAYHCYNPNNDDKRTYRPSIDEFYRAYLFPTPNSIGVIKDNMAIEFLGSSGEKTFEPFDSKKLIRPLLDFIKARQSKPMDMLGQDASKFKGIMSQQPEYIRSAQFSPLILPFGITFTSLTQEQRLVVSSMISSAMGRQNAVIHSNGDTGSGKTFTKDVISLIINIGSKNLVPAKNGRVSIPGNATFELVPTGNEKFNIITIGGDVVGTVDPSLEIKYRDENSIEGVHQISASLFELSGLNSAEVKSLLTERVKQSVTGVKGTPEYAGEHLPEIAKSGRLKDQYFILSVDEFYQLDPSQQDAIREWQIEHQSEFDVCLNCVGATPGMMFDKILEPTGISSRPQDQIVRDNIRRYIERVKKMNVDIGSKGQTVSDSKELEDRIFKAINKAEKGKNILCLPDFAEGDIVGLARTIINTPDYDNVIPVFFEKGILCYMDKVTKKAVQIERPDEIPAEMRRRGKKILLMFGADRYIGGDAKEFSRNVSKTLIVSQHELSLNRLKQAIGRNRISGDVEKSLEASRNAEESLEASRNAEESLEASRNAEESLYVDVPGIDSKDKLTDEAELRKSAAIEEWLCSVKAARHEMKIFIQSMFDNIDSEALNFLVDKYISKIKKNQRDERESALEFIHYLEEEYAKKVCELSDGELGVEKVKCKFAESILQENPEIFTNIFELFNRKALESSFRTAYGDDATPIQEIVDVLDREERLEIADLRLEIIRLRKLRANIGDNSTRAKEIEKKISELEGRINEHNNSFDETSIIGFENARPRELFYWLNIDLTKEIKATDLEAVYSAFPKAELRGTDLEAVVKAFQAVITRQRRIEELEELNHELEGLARESEELRSELEKVKNELERLRRGDEAGGDTPESITDKITELEQRIKELEDTVSEKERQIKEKDRQIKEKDGQIEEGNCQIERLKQELKEALARSAAKDGKFEKLSQLLTTRQEENEKLKRELGSSTADLAKLQREIEELRGQAKERDQQIKQLEQELENAQADLSTEQEKFREFREQQGRVCEHRDAGSGGTDLRSVNKASQTIRQEENEELIRELAVGLAGLQQKIEELKGLVEGGPLQIGDLGQAGSTQVGSTAEQEKFRKRKQLDEVYKQIREVLNGINSGIPDGQIGTIMDAVASGDSEGIEEALKDAGLKDVETIKLEKALEKIKKLEATIENLKNGLLPDDNKPIVSATLIHVNDDDTPAATEDTPLTVLNWTDFDRTNPENIFTKNSGLVDEVAQWVSQNTVTSQKKVQYGSVSVLSTCGDGKPVISMLQIGSYPPAHSSIYTEIVLSDDRILRLRDAKSGKEKHETLKGMGINIFEVKNGREELVPYDEGLKKIFHLPPKHTVEIEYDMNIEHGSTVRLYQTYGQYTCAERDRRFAKGPSSVPPTINS